ncbi:hypothetical protein Amsp01_078390 [Amycolatopsis sp. NBRC 101858]|uniref:hypothetical protein n=1 Tax=Amycolatopsis sp. NBRC 101858 TaxID=3032200 RepID=UPI00249FC68A|nr:hypothetical protein [Amycolatopsis sp. NBRC 101858]GLY41816.1 hypothetical protein Amsp01_078390 [Amycolatopsis sp. NBRC 101858]
MTLAHKGSRRITVDGTDYRWTIRPKPTYSQGLGATMTFAVELAERPGATLVVDTGRARPDNWLHLATEPVLPAEVAEGIRAALARGFDFTARPKPPSTPRGPRPAKARTT